MRKIKEVLRLRFELGLGQRQIARSCAIGLSTVHDYLERATDAEIGWPLPAGLSEKELEAKLFGNQPVAGRRRGRSRIGKRFTNNSGNIVISPCNCCGRNIGKLIPRAIGTVGFASAISNGGGAWTWFCARSTRPEKRCLSIGRGRRFPSMRPRPVRRGQPHCLFPSWAPVPTPTRKRRAISNSPTCLVSHTPYPSRLRISYRPTTPPSPSLLLRHETCVTRFYAEVFCPPRSESKLWT
jgi:hypothetical protein